MAAPGSSWQRLLLALSSIHTGTVACAPLATLVCAYPMATALFLATGGTL